MTTHNIWQMYRNVRSEIEFHQEQLRDLSNHARTLERAILARLNSVQDQYNIPYTGNSIFNRNRTLFNNNGEVLRRRNTRLQRNNQPINNSNENTREAPALTPHPYRVEDVHESSDTDPEDYQDTVTTSHQPAQESAPAATTNNTDGMVYLGTFDVPYSLLNSINTNETTPLSTSYAGSLSNRLERMNAFDSLFRIEPINSTEQENTNINTASLSSRGASVIIDYLLGEMLNRNQVHEDEPHGITDISPYVDSTTFSEISDPQNTTCPIRMDAFQPNTEVYRVKSCGHIFNKNDLRTWLNTHNTCPMCRVRIDQNIL